MKVLYLEQASTNTCIKVVHSLLLVQGGNDPREQVEVGEEEEEAFS